MSKITGGYYIKARKIQDSAIAKSPPHVREIWDWMLKTANHKDLKTYGIIIKRGQLFTSYQEIQNELSWKVGFIKKSYKKHDVDNAMCWLRQEQMITTQKTTRGLIVTVCKYVYYQDPSNYDNAYDNDNGTTRHASTINKKEEYNKEEKEMEKGISPEMLRIFKKHNLLYEEDVELDFAACLSIAYKIGKNKGWEQNDVIGNKKSQVLIIWETVVIFSASDKWFSTRSISNLNKEWQTLTQSMNGKFNPVTAEQPKIKLK